MEQARRNKILIIALILGIMGIIVWGSLSYKRITLAINLPQYYKMYLENGDYTFGNYRPTTFEDFKEMFPSITPVTLGWCIGSFVILIPAVIFNLLAWKTDSKKKKIIAGILYVFGFFTIISAIICFVSCKENRKITKLEEM